MSATFRLVWMGCVVGAFGDAPCFSGTLNVPQDFPTIQAGLDAARNGDTVLVADGLWRGDGNKNLTFHGRAVTLESSGGPDECIIDCQGSGRGFYFRDGETNTSVVRGLTVRNGRAGPGGAILIESSSPTITDCILTHNRSDSGGSAIAISDGARPVVSRCIITHNTGLSAAVSALQSGPTIVQCTIADNEAVGYFPGGINLGACTGAEIRSCLIAHNLSVGVGVIGIGGVAFSGGGQVRMLNSTIVENTAYSDVGQPAGGLHCDALAQPEISGCIVWGHEAADVRGCALRYSCVEDGVPGTGNISMDPRFVAFDNFHLRADSPCIDAGDPSVMPAAEQDIDGDARILLTQVDMGADEFRPRLHGDFDDDLDVDLDDYRMFAVCAANSGPGIPAPFTECQTFFDDDGDADVDLRDYVVFQSAFVSDCPVTVDAGTLHSVPASTGSYLSRGNELSGSVRQCGYGPGDFSVQWTVQSRPAGSGPVTVLNPTALRSRFLIAAPAVAGNYVFRLTARNVVSSKAGSDVVTLRVSDP